MQEHCKIVKVHSRLTRWRKTPAQEKHRGVFFYFEICVLLCYAQFMDGDKDNIVMLYCPNDANATGVETEIFCLWVFMFHLCIIILTLKKKRK